MWIDSSIKWMLPVLVIKWYFLPVDYLTFKSRFMHSETCTRHAYEFVQTISYFFCMIVSLVGK